jgi:uncharacterized protein YegP (UPF0339 family)
MVEVFQTNAGTWRFRICDDEGRELAASPSYASEDLAREALRKLLAQAAAYSDS